MALSITPALSVRGLCLAIAMRFGTGMALMRYLDDTLLPMRNCAGDDPMLTRVYVSLLQTVEINHRVDRLCLLL